jgi:hypothetical protein
LLWNEIKKQKGFERSQKNNNKLSLVS